MIDHNGRPRWSVAAAGLGCLLLTVCTQTATEVRWVKVGTDDQTIACELEDYNARAGAALANERGINADINATLGRNWGLSGTQALATQTMNQQAAGYADQVLNSGMRAKGFTREG